jgi:hypothetical protein
MMNVLVSSSMTWTLLGAWMAASVQPATVPSAGRTPLRLVTTEEPLLLLPVSVVFPELLPVSVVVVFPELLPLSVVFPELLLFPVSAVLLFPVPLSVACESTDEEVALACLCPFLVETTPPLLLPLPELPLLPVPVLDVVESMP